MDERYEECKGCAVMEQDRDKMCSIVESGNVDLCPCRYCLVKGVCNEPCEAYDSEFGAP